VALRFCANRGFWSIKLSDCRLIRPGPVFRAPNLPTGLSCDDESDTEPLGDGYKTLARFSVSILEEGGRLGLKCLLLSYVRVGDMSGLATIRPELRRVPHSRSMSPIRGDVHWPVGVTQPINNHACADLWRLTRVVPDDRGTWPAENSPVVQTAEAHVEFRDEDPSRKTASTRIQC
jgi:hypothetical protein